MEAMFNFIPAPIALVLMLIGFAALAVGAIRLGYKQYVKQWAAARAQRKRRRSLLRCAAHCRTG